MSDVILPQTLQSTLYSTKFFIFIHLSENYSIHYYVSKSQYYIIIYVNLIINYEFIYIILADKPPRPKYLSKGNLVTNQIVRFS